MGVLDLRMMTSSRASAAELNPSRASSQVPVAGGRTSASTCTSITNGLLALIACSSAPLKSSDLVTVMASTPAARAQAAKSGLYGLAFGPSWNMVPSSRPPNIPN